MNKVIDFKTGTTISEGAPERPELARYVGRPVLCIFCGSGPHEREHFAFGARDAACICDQCSDTVAAIIRVKREGSPGALPHE